MVDVQALAGDSTDNVPGAPGIGLKTAAQLILEYGDLETLLARAGEIKQPKRRDVLTNPDNVALIRVSKQLVTLDREVPVETPLEALATPQLDGKALIAFLKAMELTTITRRVAEICGVDASEVEPDPRFAGPAGWRNRNGEGAEPGGVGVSAPPQDAAAARPSPKPAAARRPPNPSISSKPGRAQRASPSIARPMQSCAPRPSLATGSPARGTRVWSPSMRRPRRPIRYDRS